MAEWGVGEGYGASWVTASAPKRLNLSALSGHHPVFYPFVAVTRVNMAALADTVSDFYQKNFTGRNREANMVSLGGHYTPGTHKIH